MKTVDFFAGCGGMSLGFQNAGFQILRAYDNWQEAINCYKANFHHEALNRDISEVERIIEELSDLEIEVIIGGPPCQDFSHAGKRNESHRANLTTSYAEIVAGANPPWFVMENVERTFKSESYKRARGIFKSGGYGLTEVVLDSSYYGVPQKRKRFFSIGHKGEKDGFLAELLEELRASRPITLREYFEDNLDFEYYYRHPRNYNRRAIYSIDEPAATVRGVNRPIPSGYSGHHCDPVPVSDNIRPLTTRERAMIQTFPENFILNGSKTAIEQLIGNAVPVNLATVVGEAILHYNSGKWNSKTRKQLAISF